MPVDVFIEGPHGELDWAMAEDEETWRDLDETLNSVDTFILTRMIRNTIGQWQMQIFSVSSLK